jgi:hypothetical protein
MNESRSRIANRRIARVGTLCAAALMGLSTLSGTVFAQPAGAPQKIGIIGTGHMGSALATRWAGAGHALVISSRHPDELKGLAASLGPNVRVGTPREAAAFGDVVLVSVPYAATPQIGKDYARELAGKLVIDTGNPEPRRDGKMAVAAKRKGTGLASAAFLAGTRVVRAFNCIPAGMVKRGATLNGERIAIPIAGDDPAAVKTAEGLVRDAGFEPVLVGSLRTASSFDLGAPLARGQHTAAQLRKMIADLHAGASQ